MKSVQTHSEIVPDKALISFVNQFWEITRVSYCCPAHQIHTAVFSSDSTLTTDAIQTVNGNETLRKRKGYILKFLGVYH